VVRGEVKVNNPPVDLNQSSWTQFVYQPQSETVTLTGFAPGRYTVVWTSFHIQNAQQGPKVFTVDVPGRNAIDLTAM
jgi:hypothetical protein